MQVTIRPDHIGPELRLEVNPINPKQGLEYAAARFGQMLGLSITDLVRKTVADGTEIVNFRIGTDRTFYVFEGWL
jgi:hypothetical protein